MGGLHGSAALDTQQIRRAWKQYVQNRVEVIKGLTNGEDWNFFLGELNPADLPSRGVSAKELVHSSIWWHGPNIIAEKTVSQPMLPDVDVSCEVEAELTKSQSIYIPMLCSS